MRRVAALPVKWGSAESVPVAVDTRGVYDDLAALYLPVAIVVFAAIVVALVWVLRAQGRPREERTGLEIGYAAALAATAAVLIAFTFRATDRENARAAGPVDVVRVTAGKWDWHFQHADGRVETNVLTVRAGTEVEFRATSVDVIHGFWIPALKFQRQLIPGQTATFRLTFPRKAWLTSGVCSFFCGLEHARMRFSVDVEAG
jgi:heme/copper-type cytochrome/quinol oxidase subunit 2